MVLVLPASRPPAAAAQLHHDERCARRPEAISKRCCARLSTFPAAALQTAESEQNLADAVTVRNAESDSDLKQAARIRADSYYEVRGMLMHVDMLPF